MTATQIILHALTLGQRDEDASYALRCLGNHLVGDQAYLFDCASLKAT